MARSGTKENADVFNIVVVNGGTYELHAVDSERQHCKRMACTSCAVDSVEERGGAIKAFEVGMGCMVYEKRVSGFLSRLIGEVKQKRVGCSRFFQWKQK